MPTLKSFDSASRFNLIRALLFFFPLKDWVFRIKFMFRFIL